MDLFFTFPNHISANKMDSDLKKNGILDQLSIFNQIKPPGTDGFTPRIIKEFVRSILKPMTNLFNMFLVKKTISHSVRDNSCKSNV